VGTYNVTLVITGHGGSNTTIKQNYIVVGVGAILDGHVNLQGRPGAPHASWITELTVNFLQGGGVVRTEPVTTDNEGKFTVPDVAAGTYDICVKSPRALSELETVVMVSGTTIPVDFDTLREGDANNDDAISLADYALLYAAYGSEPGDGNWNDNCDFNRNGAVDLGDYALLYSNYGQSGDCSP
jgi:PKD repeat protein